MKIKLDENLGNRIREIFRKIHNDVETVSGERLNGSKDAFLFEICKKEQRILVTLDLDFSNLLRFSLTGTAGIVILRPNPHSFRESLEFCANLAAHELVERTIQERLWIVQPDRIRIRPALTVLE